MKRNIPITRLAQKEDTGWRGQSHVSGSWQCQAEPVGSEGELKECQRGGMEFLSP